MNGTECIATGVIPRQTSDEDHVYTAQKAFRFKSDFLGSVLPYILFY